MPDEDLKGYEATEMDEAFIGPAVAANRFVVVAGGNGIRIAFLEQVPDTKAPHFRSAVLLSEADAEEMATVLASVLGQHRARAVDDNA